MLVAASYLSFIFVKKHLNHATFDVKRRLSNFVSLRRRSEYVQVVMHLLLHVALYDWVSSRRLNLDWSREYLIEWSRDGRKLGNPLTLHLLFSTSINVLEIKLGVASKIMALAKIFFTAAMICAEWTDLLILRAKRRVFLLIMRWFYLPVDIK